MTVRGGRHDLAPALPHRGGDPVHHRRARHLPQPPQRDPDADGDRADPARGQHQPRRFLGLSRGSHRASAGHVRPDRRRRRSRNWSRHPRHLLPPPRLDRGRRRQPDARLMHPVLLIVFLPLIAAIVAGLFGRWIGKTAAKVVTTGALFIGAILSWPIFLQYISGSAAPAVVPVMTWIQSGTMTVDW